MTDVAKLKFQVDTKGIKSAQRELGNLEKRGKSTTSTMKTLAPIFATLITLQSLRTLITYSDKMTLINSKLKLVTSSSKELKSIQESLFRIAQRSRVGLEATVDLYSRMARATKRAGVSQKDLLSITETISKSMIISGGTTQSMNAALIQLTQGFQSGTLRGQELNSVLEQSPRLATAIADGMSVAVGDLRRLAEQGKITTQVVIDSLLTQGITIGKEFSEMNTTVAQSISVLGNSTLTLLGNLNDASGATKKLAELITSLSKGIDNLGINLKEMDDLNSIDEMNDKMKILLSQLEDVEKKKDSFSGFNGITFGLNPRLSDNVWDTMRENIESNIKILQSKINNAKLNQKDESVKPIKSLTQAEKEQIGKKEISWLKQKIKLKNQLALIGLSSTEALVVQAEQENTLLLKQHNDQKGAMLLIEKVYRKKLDDLSAKSKEEQIDKLLVQQNLEFDFRSRKLELLDTEYDRSIGLADIEMERFTAEQDASLAKQQINQETYDKRMILEQKITDKVKDGFSRMSMAQKSVLNELERSMGSFFDFADKGFLDFGALAKNVLNEILNQMIAMQIIKPIVGAISSGVSGSNSTPEVTLNAKGGAYNSPSLSEHSNSIVSKTTPFMFAQGGVPNLGIMGEAGSEAIMPLTRTSGGDLGVKAIGGGNAQNVIINIENNSGQEIEQESKTSFNAESMIVNVVLSAISRNKFGARDTIKGVR